MPDTKIRPAGPDDAAKLLALIDIASSGFVRHLFGKAAPAGMEVDDFIVSQMESADSGLSYSKLRVAEIDGAVAGFIAIDQIPEEPGEIEPDTPDMFRPLTELEHEAPGCCLINLVATFPEFRGRGAGLALMRFAEEHHGQGGLCLTVGDTNLAAQDFYRRLGYRIAGRRPVVKEGWINPYAEWLLMVKA